MPKDILIIMKAFLPIVGLAFVISGCVSELDRPHGTGIVGSAYGYSDQKLGKGSYKVSFHGADAEDAGEGLKRRATALCQAEGFKSAGYSSSFSNQEDIVVASAQVTCSNKAGAQIKGGSSEAAELAALKAERNSLNSGGYAGMGQLGAIAGAVEDQRRRELDQRISSIEPAQSAAGGGAMALGACEKNPTCKAASDRALSYRDRIFATVPRQSVHKSADAMYCIAMAGAKAFSICEEAHKRAGDSACAAEARGQVGEMQALAAQSRNQAEQTWGGPGAYSPNCPSF